MKYDILGIGGALVDVLAAVPDSFLAEEDLHKGSMRLIDEPTANRLYARMDNPVRISGGSAANTLVGMASLGSKAACVSKTADDELGAFFKADMAKAGVDLLTPPLTDGAGTGSCCILITPDGERTMNTFLGANTLLSPTDIAEDQIASAEILYLEGYTWDSEAAKKAILKALETARKHKKKTALTLSDLFCVARHRTEFLELIQGRIDILFANESEIQALMEDKDTLSAVRKAGKTCPLVVVTLGAKGALAFTNGTPYSVPAAPVEKVVDTTGAGDLFAAGFLKGLIEKKSVTDALSLGALCSSEIISHTGAHPQQNLLNLAKAKSLL